MNPWQFGTWVEEQGELSVGGESWVGGSVFFSDENVTGTAAAAVAGAWLDWMLAGPVLEGHRQTKHRTTPWSTPPPIQSNKIKSVW